MQKMYLDPVENQTYYVVKRVSVRGRDIQNEAFWAPSFSESSKWKEQDEAKMAEIGRTASYATAVCKTKREAERNAQKIRGRR
jgi:hypothetical protein